MFNFPSWKSIVTYIVIFISLFIVIISYYKDDKGYGVNLGLDLQGGSYLNLQADQQKLIKEYLFATTNKLSSFINNANYGTFYIDQDVENKKLVINFSDTINDKQFQQLENYLFTLNSALDLTISDDKLHLSVLLNNKALEIVQADLIASSIEVVRMRVDKFGTNESVIKKQGYDHIIVELPGVDNPEKIKRVLGTTARLTFHLVDIDATFKSQRLPIGYKWLTSQNTSIRYAVKSLPELYGSDLTTAKLQFDQQKPVIFFKFNKDATRKFAQLTTDNINSMLAIVIDNKVISAPTINTPLTTGEGIITGSFTVEEAQELALLLSSGSLPISLNIVEERTVGPTLGMVSIKYGVISAAIGYVLLFVFMFVFYKKLGLIANLSLLVNVLLIFASLSLFGATLTLPGIAGIILTIGMSVDANILVYERLAQELRKPVNTSLGFLLSNAFDRVFITIVDSNLTTLITAIFLFSLTSGTIQGFAVTLIIGILTSIFSIMFVSRTFIKLLLVSKKYNKINL